MKLSDGKFAAAKKVAVFDESSFSDDVTIRIAQMIGQLPESAIKDMIVSLKNSGADDDKILQEISSTGLAGDMQIGDSAKRVIDIMKGGPDSPAGMSAHPGNFHRDTLSQTEIEGTGKIGQLEAPSAPVPAESMASPDSDVIPDDLDDAGPPVYERDLGELFDSLAADIGELQERVESGETMLEGQSLEPVDDAGFSPDPFESKVAGPLDEDDFYSTDKVVRGLPSEMKGKVLQDFYTNSFPKSNYTSADVGRVYSEFGDVVHAGQPKQYTHLTLAEKKLVDQAFKRETTPGEIDLLKSIEESDRKDITNERQRKEREQELSDRKQKRTVMLDEPQLAPSLERSKQDAEDSAARARELSQKNYDQFGQKIVRPRVVEKADQLRKLKVDKIRKTFPPMPTKEMKVRHDYKNVPLSRDEIEKNVNPIINNIKQKDKDITPEELASIKRELMESFSTADLGPGDTIYKKVAPEILKYEFYDTDEGLTAAEQLAKEFAADPAHSYGKTIKIIEVARDQNGDPIPATEEYVDQNGRPQTKTKLDENGEIVYKPKVFDDVPTPEEAQAEHAEKMRKMREDPEFASRQKWIKRMTTGGLDAIKPPSTAADLSALYEELSSWPTAQRLLKEHFDTAGVTEGAGLGISPASEKLVNSYLATPKFKTLLESIKAKAKTDVDSQREKAKSQDPRYQTLNKPNPTQDKPHSNLHMPGPIQNLKSPVLKDRAMDKIKTDLAKNQTGRPSVDDVMSLSSPLRNQYLTKDEQGRLLRNDPDVKQESQKLESDLSGLNKQINSVYNKYKSEHASLVELLHDRPSLKSDTDFISKFFESENMAQLVDALNRDPSMKVEESYGPEILELKRVINERNDLRDRIMQLKKPSENVKQNLENVIRQRQIGLDPLPSTVQMSEEAKSKLLDVKNRMPKLESKVKELERKIVSDPSLRSNPAFMHSLDQERASRDVARSELTSLLKTVPPPKSSVEKADRSKAAPPAVIPRSDPQALEEYLKGIADRSQALAAAERARQRGADYDIKREQEMRKVIESASPGDGTGASTDDILAAMGAADQWTEDTMETMKKLDYLREALQRNMDDRLPLGTKNYEDPLIQAAVARFGNEWSSKAIKMTKGTPSFSRGKYLNDTGKMDALLPLDLVLKLDKYRRSINAPKLADGLPGLSPAEIDLAYDIIRGYLVETKKIMSGIVRRNSEDNKMNKNSSLAFDELVVADAITTVEDYSATKIAASDISAIIDFMSEERSDNMASESDMKIAALVSDSRMSRVAATAVVGYILDFGDRVSDVLTHDRLSIYRAAISKIPELSKVAAGMKTPKVNKDHSDSVKVDSLSDKADSDDAASTRPAHINFDIVDSEKVGSYAIVDVEWDTSDDSVSGVGHAAMEQALRSFMKGRESDKNFLDWGFTGKITISDLDLDGGKAVITFATDKGADSPTLVKTN